MKEKNITAKVTIISFTETGSNTEKLLFLENTVVYRA